jgi:hypothetical protein
VRLTKFSLLIAAMKRWLYFCQDQFSRAASDILIGASVINPTDAQVGGRRKRPRGLTSKHDGGSRVALYGHSNIGFYMY